MQALGKRGQKGGTAAAVAVSGEVNRVPAQFLRQVFNGKPLPFPVNPDGSVDRAVYQAWLEQTWALGVEALAQGSIPLSAPGEAPLAASPEPLLKVVHERRGI